MAQSKKSKVSVLLDQEESARFDRYCSERGFKKSTLIARLIREHLASEGYNQQHLFDLGITQGGEANASHS